MADEKARVEFAKDERPESYVDGRNGCFSLSAIEAWASVGGVHIDGVGKKGRTLRGGFFVTTDAMDRLALRWLQARGIVMPAA